MIGRWLPCVWLFSDPCIQAIRRYSGSELNGISMQRSARLLALALLSAACCLPAFAQTPAAVWPGAQWQRAAPEELGMDSRALATLVEYGANAQMDSLLVTRYGKVVGEAYYSPLRPA
ncbi:MAG: beta-lactamase [Ramlibacter sp.]|nr:beta-lactamase [Ramlibacter sp.]